MSRSYRLTRPAERQIEEVIEYTDKMFGESQTLAYISGLQASFEQIGQFPGIGVAAFEIKAGWRRYRYQSHYIFYRVSAEHVVIEAVIHTRRRIRPDLFDDC